MKKVLFVISYLDKGGTERALSNITMNFPKEFEIEILVNSDKVVDYPYKGRIISLGIDEKPRTGSALFQLGVLIKRVKKLRILKKQNHYAACISFLDSANIANIISGKKYCKTIVSVRNSLKEQQKLPQYKYIVNPLVRIFYNSADQIVAVSKGIEWELINFFRLNADKVLTIENGYNIDEICCQGNIPLENTMLSYTQGKKVIVTSGRLSEQKGQWHLIRAFAKVLEQVSDAVLIVLGTGSLEQYLKDVAQKCRVADRILFVGYTSNPYQYVSKADVFVMTSLYEGFPNALAEAVCLGIPCIATDFQTGSREILSPELLNQTDNIRDVQLAEYGILTPVCSGKRYSGNEELEDAEIKVAEAIKILLVDKETNKKYRIQSKIRSESLGIDFTVRKWTSIINE